jgi:hypothetical protein
LRDSACFRLYGELYPKIAIPGQDVVPLQFDATIHPVSCHVVLGKFSGILEDQDEFLVGVLSVELQSIFDFGATVAMVVASVSYAREYVVWIRTIYEDI